MNYVKSRDLTQFFSIYLQEAALFPSASPLGASWRRGTSWSEKRWTSRSTQSRSQGKFPMRLLFLLLWDFWLIGCLENIFGMKQNFRKKNRNFPLLYGKTGSVTCRFIGPPESTELEYNELIVPIPFPNAWRNTRKAFSSFSLCEGYSTVSKFRHCCCSSVFPFIFRTDSPK